jgi:hypothetical protein
MLCLERGFPTPLFRLCGSKDEVIRFAKETGYPIVIKPPANQSSRGATRCSQRRMSIVFPGHPCVQPGRECTGEEFRRHEFTGEGFKTPSGYSWRYPEKAHSHTLK